MSVISIVTNGRTVELLVKPDPSRSPQTLDELLGIGLPAEVQAEDGTRIVVGIALERWLAGKLPSEQHAAVRGVFCDLVAAVQHHPHRDAVLLGELEHVVFAVPRRASAAAVDAFLTEIDVPGVELSAVAEDVARLAALGDGPVSGLRFVLCEWGEDLTLRAAFTYDTLRHVAPVGRGHRRAGVGMTALARALRPVVAAADPDGEQLDSAELERVTTTACLAAADAEAGALLTFPVAGDRSVELASKDVETALRPLLTRCRNFLGRAAGTLRDEGASTALLVGTFGERNRFRALARSVLEAAGFAVVGKEHSVGVGLHYCVRAKPKLQYDCGVILRPAGLEHGVGTLVLVRPTSIGQQRISEVLELCAREGEALEIAFYLRRLVFGPHGVRLEHELFNSRPFAASLDNGVARIQVTMRVDQPEEDDGVRVTAQVRDRNADTTLSFEGMPLQGGRALERPPLRSADELGAAPWVEQMRGAIKSTSGKTFAVEAWRKHFETEDRIPRQRYAEQIVRAAAIEPSSQLANPQFVKTALPAKFQAEARAHLFAAMHVLAQRNNRRKWIVRYPAGRVPIEQTCADALLNSLTTALAADPNAAPVVERIKTVHRFFGLACMPPESLNIDW